MTELKHTTIVQRSITNENRHKTVVLKLLSATQIWVLWTSHDPNLKHRKNVF